MPLQSRRSYGAYLLAHRDRVERQTSSSATDEDLTRVNLAKVGLIACRHDDNNAAIVVDGISGDHDYRAMARLL